MNLFTCLVVISFKFYVKSMTLLMFVLLLASVNLFSVNSSSLFVFALHCRCFFLASCSIVLPVLWRIKIYVIKCVNDNK